MIFNGWMKKRRDDDGISRREWNVLVESARAANSGKVGQFQQVMRDWNSTSLNSRLLVGYVLVALQDEIEEQLGRFPTTADLLRIADDIYDKWKCSINYGEDYLRNTLQTTFGYATNDSSVAPPKLTVGAVVALGCVLEEPISGMANLRPKVANCFEQQDFAG